MPRHRTNLTRRTACGLLASPFLLNAARNPDAQERSLYVTVEKGDQLVLNLQRGNFRVRVEDEPVPFRLAEPEEEIRMAILVEYSASSWPYFNDIARGLQGFLDKAPEGNWYALAAFDQELKILQDFTQRRGELRQGLGKLNQPFWQDINTYDAVWTLVDRMSRLDGRKAIVFIGSGIDTFSGRTLDDVKHKLEASDVTIFPAGAGSAMRTRFEQYMNSSQRMTMMQARAFLQMLADKSGGMAFFPRFELGFRDAMEGALQVVKHQYHLICEVPPAKDEFLDVDVTAFSIQDDRRTDYDVRHRDGWRSGG